MEFIHRIAERLGLVYLNIRLHLAHNAAYVFPAVNRSHIYAGRHYAALPAGNAADIISRMFIADFPIIHAAGYHTVRIPGNPPCIHAAEQFRPGVADIDA